MHLEEGLTRYIDREQSIFLFITVNIAYYRIDVWYFGLLDTVVVQLIYGMHIEGSKGERIRLDEYV
jgi:hypothetical protein